MPTKEPPTIPSKLVHKIVGQLDLEKLAAALADSLSKKLLESLEVDKLANIVFDRFAEELQEGIVSAIISKM